MGTTSNIFIHAISDIYERYISQYIRYEIFRKDNNAICSENKISDKSETEKETHAVSSYLKAKIEAQCDEVKAFVCSKKAEENLKPRDNLGDSRIIASCEKKISRGYILKTILHEMGHSFGLGHNFKASTDKENYYSLEEVKSYFPMAREPIAELPKASSVMDYTSNYTPPLTVPGKYDLAVLRYLYLNQVEKKEGGLLSLEIPENPDLQQPLSENTLSQMKVYASCWDTVENTIRQPIIFMGNIVGYTRIPYVVKTDTEDFLCLIHDYGSSPLEIVQNDIKQFQHLSAWRYAYANKAGPNFGISYRRVLGFYNKWLRLRDEYLSSTGQTEKIWSLFDDEKSVKEYQSAIERGLCEGESLKKNKCSKTEYDLYYPVHKVASDLLMDILFLKTMKCEVQDSKGWIRQLDLDYIKEKLLPKHREQLYVEDCNSDQIQDFFREKDLTYMGQTGWENFFSYYSQGIEKDKIDLFPVSKLLVSLILDVDGQKNEKGEIVQPGLNDRLKALGEGDSTIDLMVLINEPDFLQNFLNLLREDFLSGKENGSSNFDLWYRQVLFGKIIQKLVLQLNNTNLRIQQIVRQNLKYFQYLEFNSASGQDSFYKEILEPLDKLSPSEVFSGIPFLMEAYENLIDRNPKEDSEKLKEIFQKYLIERDDTLDDTKETNTFKIPLISGNFCRKALLKIQ